MGYFSWVAFFKMDYICDIEIYLFSIVYDMKHNILRFKFFLSERFDLFMYKNFRYI